MRILPIQLFSFAVECRLAAIGALRYRETNGQIDDNIMPIADHTACNSTIG